MINPFIDKRRFLNSGWNISTLVNTYNYPTSLAGNEGGIYLKPDGLVVYITGFSNNIHQLDLSTAWDLSTATLRDTTTGINTGNQGISFKPDGTKMYIAANVTDGIYEYNLSTAWDVTTFSFVQNIALPVIVTGLFIKSDGLKMYTSNLTTSLIYEHTLSTAWDISSITTGSTLDVSSKTTTPDDVFFKPDGSKMYITDGSIWQYNLGTAWDITTAVYSQTIVASSASNGLYIRDDGFKAYTANNNSTPISEYDLT